jgi:hypothetical protein
MPLSKLAKSKLIREDSRMASVPQQVTADLTTSRFELEATESLNEIKHVFSDVLARLGVRRPVDLQRKLKLDVTLSWQIFKVAGERSALAAGAAMPSRSNVEKFARNAAENGVGAGEIASLSTAYERFEKVVERHAGDRTSFISLVTGAAGLSDDWMATDLQHRRNMFRGMSHIMGLQARARICSYILTRNNEDESHPFQMLVASGYVNLRTLRKIDHVRVHGARIQGHNENTDFSAVEHHAFGLAGRGGLLEEFCSHPLPEMRIDHGELHMDTWVETSLVRPDVGNLGSATVMFADKFLSKDLGSKLKQVATIPCEVLMLDLIVPPGLMEGEPKLEVFLGDDRPVNRSSDLTPVIGKNEFICLGKGPGMLTTAEMANYPDMIRAVADKEQIDVSSYDVWRARIEFPVYQSTSRISWHLKTN